MLLKIYRGHHKSVYLMLLKTSSQVDDSHRLQLSAQGGHPGTNLIKITVVNYD